MPLNFLNASPKIFEFFVQEFFKLGIENENARLGTRLAQ
jgi:hypothetical protein